MAHYLIQVVTSSPAVADLILQSDQFDTVCTGGVRDLGNGMFAIHAIVEHTQFAALRQLHGVLRLDTLVDVEANHRARLQELMGRPAF